MAEKTRQIGQVADEVGLSLRTIRYYEEIGLVEPSDRSAGGFRLYTDDDVARLLLIKQMKPLEFTLDEMRDLLGARDRLASGTLSGSEATALAERLEMYAEAAESRCAALREQLDNAEEFALVLRRDHRRARSVARAR